MNKITVESIINADIEKVWKYWTEPAHIQNWNAASEDWHCPHAENDLIAGGKFRFTMASKDGSMSFDFEGIYDQVVIQKHISYTLGDGRQVRIEFIQEGPRTKVIEEFDPETINSIELQKSGWQAILDHFKNYTEAH